MTFTELAFECLARKGGVLYWDPGDGPAPASMCWCARTKSGYEFTLGRGTYFTSRIARWNAGVGRQLAVENSTVWVAGDVPRAEATGTTLRLYRNNVLVLATTDATIASGRAGITIYAATIADVELDDFSVGNF